MKRAEEREEPELGRDVVWLKKRLVAPRRPGWIQRLIMALSMTLLTQPTVLRAIYERTFLGIFSALRCYLCTLVTSTASPLTHPPPILVARCPTPTEIFLRNKSLFPLDSPRCEANYPRFHIGSGCIRILFSFYLHAGHEGLPSIKA